MKTRKGATQGSEAGMRNEAAQDVMKGVTG